MLNFNPKNLAQHIFTLLQERDQGSSDLAKREALAYTHFLIASRIRTANHGTIDTSAVTRKEVESLQKLIMKADDQARNLSSNAQLIININHALSEENLTTSSGTDHLLSLIEQIVWLTNLSSPAKGRKVNDDAVTLIETVIQVFESATGQAISDTEDSDSVHAVRQRMTKLYQLADIYLIGLPFYQSAEAIRKQIKRHLDARSQDSDIYLDVKAELESIIPK